MKKAILMLCLLLFSITSEIWIEKAYAPELFGNANIVSVGLYPYVNKVGLIFNKSYVFAFREKEVEGFVFGSMVHVFGSPIVGADKPISFLKHYNSTKSRFSGWIYFREHERPFCGSMTNQDFPKACRWRK